MPTKPPTIKQRRAVEDTLANLTREKPKTKKAILKDAGYSTAVSMQPHLVIESKGFQQLLQENLPEDLVTQRHRELLSAGSLSHYEFYAKGTVASDEVMDGDMDPEDDAESFLEPQASGGALRRNKKAKTNRVRDIASDKEIEDIINSIPGCKLIYIKQFGTGSKTAYFQTPDNRSRKDAIDLAYKLRGSYAPDKSVVVKVTHNSNPKIKKVVKQFEVNLKKVLLEKPHE